MIYEGSELSLYQNRVDESNSEFEKTDDQNGWRFVFGNSWWDTVHREPKVNMEKCKEWCKKMQTDEHMWIYWYKRLPGVAGRIEHMSDEEIKERYIVVSELKAQITWEGLTCKYLCWEACCNICSGHRSHARVTNDLLEEWFLEDPAIQDYFGVPSDGPADTEGSSLEQ